MLSVYSSNNKNKHFPALASRVDTMVCREKVGNNDNDAKSHDKDSHRELNRVINRSILKVIACRSTVKLVLSLAYIRYVTMLKLPDQSKYT